MHVNTNAYYGRMQSKLKASILDSKFYKPIGLQSLVEAFSVSHSVSLVERMVICYYQ